MQYYTVTHARWGGAEVWVQDDGAMRWDFSPSDLLCVMLSLDDQATIERAIRQRPHAAAFRLDLDKNLSHPPRITVQRLAMPATSC
jgi:hypothetical protein